MLSFNFIKGCISWTWYFPHHYGPMLQDMKRLKQIHDLIDFKLGSPFKPFQQLLGCLPPLSRKLLPMTYQWLMGSSSPVYEFYPSDFAVDMTHKRNPWEVCINSNILIFFGIYIMSLTTSYRQLYFFHLSMKKGF